MDMKTASSLLRELQPNERRVLYTSSDGIEITATRTDKICPHDFAVGLVIPGREEFYPTHIRLLFDLYLKRLADSKNAHILFCLLEKIYDGIDPEELVAKSSELKFSMKLDDPDVILYYTQLFMIEQEFNYGPDGCKKGKVEPPREFLMRFIRWVASGEEEIDKIITSAVRNWPPLVRYGKRLQCD